MPRNRGAAPELDERTARIGRELYADVRRRDAVERAEIRQPRRSGSTGVDAEGGPLSWFFDADACPGDDGGDGGSE